jgi:phage-related minor tail protein
MGQLRFAWNEMQGPESAAFGNLRSSTSLRGATGAFIGYERPSGWSAGNPEGGHNFSGRLAGAEQVLQKFTGTAQQATATTASMAQAATGATGGLGQFTNALSQFPAAPTAPAGGGGGNWFSSLFGGFGMSASAISPSASAWLTSNPGGFTGLWGNGGAFLSGHVTPFASGGVVGRPTLFPMAGGAGLMGEDEPEAIMPLRRGPDGKLGVASRGGGGLNLTVVNNVNAEVTARESQDGKGWELLIEERMADRVNTHGTPLNRATRAATSGRLKRR